MGTLFSRTPKTDETPTDETPTGKIDAQLSDVLALWGFEPTDEQTNANETRRALLLAQLDDETYEQPAFLH